jgi:hypothetical protein
VGDHNTPLSPIDTSSRQKINKETSELLYTLDQLIMIDIYRVFYPTIWQSTFFSEAHWTFSKTDHIVGHKTSLNKFRKIEITPFIITVHNGIRLDLNNKRNHRNTQTNGHWTNNTLMKNQWMNEEIREEIKKFLESNEN